MSTRPPHTDVIDQKHLAELVRQAAAKVEGDGTDRRGAEEDRPAAPPTDLSFAQQRLWFLERLYGDTGAYIVPLALRIDGPLDADRLHNTIRSIVARHEILRTAFPAIEGQPSRVTFPDVRLPFISEEMPSEAEEAWLETWITAEVTKPFDLASGPLIRCALLRRSENEHILVVTMHHIVADGWSLMLFVEEMKALYQGSELPPLPLQYSDCINWQRRHVSGPAADRMLRYWQDVLQPSNETLSLSANRPRPALPSFSGAQQRRTLGAELSARLRSAATKGGLAGKTLAVTPFMILLAAYKITLSTFSGQGNITIGCPVANRRQLQSEKLIGFFVNTLPLNLDFDETLSFRRAIAATAERSVQAFEYEDMPFEQIVANLQPERSLAYNPVFQAAFVMQNMTIPSLEFASLSLKPLAVKTGKAKFDLTLEIIELEGQYELTLEYATDLFDEDEITRIFDHYLAVLEAGLINPDQRIDSLTSLSARDTAKLATWNDTSVRWPDDAPDIVTVIRRAAKLFPTAEAVVTDERVIDFKELDHASDQLARRLNAAGIGPEKPVALYFDRSVELVVSMLAVLKAGGAFLPIDPSLPVERVETMIHRADARLVLGNLANSGLSASIRDMALPDISPQQEAALSRIDLNVRIDPDAAAYIIYTSGSTGTPKAVVNTHRGLLNRILWMQDSYRLTADDRVFQKTPATFDVSVWEFLWPLTSGAAIVMARPGMHTDSRHLAETIDGRHVTVMHFVPSLLSLFLQETKEKAFPALRLIVCSGEALSADLRDECLRRIPAAQLENLYGPTEAAIDVSRKSCRPGDGPIVTIGHPIANTQLHILDDALQPVPLGAPGQLFIGGDNLARGYAFEAALTATQFVPDPFSGEPGARLYATGDLARFSTDGEILFLGRRDNQVKLHGVRIEPGEIETALTAQEEIKDAVVGLCGGPRGDRLVAVIVPQDQAAIDPAAIRARLAQNLPDAMVPTRICIAPSLQRGSSGKLDRSRIYFETMVQKSNEVLSEGRPIRSVAEARLLRIWQELLPVPAIATDDDFFDLGGHSLLAIRLVSRINDVFRISLPLRTLFQARTIAAQARIMEAMPVPNPEPAPHTPAPAAFQADPKNRFEPFPLNAVQQAYWIGRRSDMTLGGTAAHLYVEIDCKDFSHAAIENAFNRLIMRHDMLRCIVAADGTQRVLADVPHYRIRHTDMRELPPKVRARALNEFRENLSHQILPLDRWPLFDIRSSQLDDCLRLHISFDLMIGDALSWINFCREWGLVAGHPQAVLPEPGITFRDYILTTERQNRNETSVRYWQARLDDIAPAPDLPFAPGRSATKVAGGFKRYSGRMPAELWAATKKRAAGFGLTPSALLMTAFSEVLRAWSASPRFTLNITLFNRQPLHPDVTAIVGDFTSLTLLTVEPFPTLDFVDRALAIQNQLLDDLDHRDYSGLDVLRELARRRGHAMMPVVFSSILPQFGEGQDTSTLRELGELVYGITQTPQIFCDHQVYEEAGELRYNWDIVEELFPAGLWETMFEAYRALLDRLATEPESWHEKHPLDLSARQIELQAAANDTGNAFPDLTLLDLFEAQARKTPEAVAILAPRRVLSFQELDDASGGISQWLAANGARSETLVAIVMQKGWEQVVAALAILKSGAAYLPIDADLPPARINELLEISQTSLVLTQSWIDARLEWGDTIRRFRVDQDITEPQDLTPAGTRPKPDSLAYVIYTSGSTGMPKGVEITHRAAANTILDINERHDIWPGDRIFGISSLSFDLSVYDVFGTLAAGAALVLPHSAGARDPQHWLARMRECDVSVWNSVPALAELLVDCVERGEETLPSSLRLMMLSGDWIPVSLPQRIFDRSHPRRVDVISLGGATEAAIWSIAYPIHGIDPAWTSIPYGKPLRNQTIHVLDDNFNSRPVWAQGKIFIAGSGLANGYWKDPKETERRFLLHPATGERLYDTGDLGRWLPDGNVDIIGRADNQVKINGYRVELGEIETRLRRHPHVDEAIVVAIGRKRREIAAFFVPSPDRAVDSASLRRHLETCLPAYMLPSSLQPLTAFPLTPNGKVDRSKLVSQAQERSAARIAADQPVSGPVKSREGAATRIAALASDILNIAVGPQDDLIECGATSVDIVKLANAMDQELSLKLDFVTFYRQPTPAGLAASSGGRLDVTDGTLLDPAEREAFKNSHSARLALDGERHALPSFDHIYASAREFAAEPVTLTEIRTLLAALTAAQDDEGVYRFTYASAGSRYAVRTYLHVEGGKVADLSAGLYYLDPWHATLTLLDTEPGIRAEIHDPSNRRLYAQSAFSIFLVAHMPAVTPLYGEKSIEFCRIEAGAIAQILREQASRTGTSNGMQLGLCPIGHVDFGSIRDRFHLAADDVLLHSFVGGRRAVDAKTGGAP
ncbi:amino acid adenylation domain-containing protein [Neorhizobium huautlense]|uniref:Amino acid adenylation domain-containing protein n=1 Tax=Neorhizobium huautlense TaxID=67774 RepID=A0ABT9PV83_9HYPH|nr:non-ribosomal peptide synthetase [Neorhizobium huautlense]MDP9838382.1 amino acid adenylation domain-containing protein [Neorhizobium huautlense]